MRPVVGGLYAGNAFTAGSDVVVAMLDAGMEKRVRFCVLGRHVCKLFEVMSWLGLAGCLTGRSDVDDSVLRHEL